MTRWDLSVASEIDESSRQGFWPCLPGSENRPCLLWRKVPEGLSGMFAELPPLHDCLPTSMSLTLRHVNYS